MKVTNKHNLPEVIYRASRRDSYSRGASDISVTQLINSPRIVRLTEKHHEDIEVDVVDRIWALMGTTVHKMLEDHNDESITEQRLFCKVNGWTISGGIDVRNFIDGMHGLVDYKMTSVWSVMLDKPEWEYQLNTYAYLVLRTLGIRVDKLQICAILRDWRRSDAEHKRDYPQQPIVMVDIPLWSPYEQSNYVYNRVEIHQDAKRADDWGEELPYCTDHDRWIRDTKWAVTKAEGQRAIRRFDSKDEADGYAAGKSGVIVEHRPGKPVRCLGYCQVSDWCDQWQNERKARKTLEAMEDLIDDF